MDEPMIELSDVSFGFGKDEILSNVNFVVEKQEYVGIIGANGAGKSTLMRLILGQLSPDKGTVTVNAKGTGYVPQVGFREVSQFPANVEEVVMTGLYKEIGLFHLPKKEHREKVNEVLKLVGMEEYSARMLSELSGGQQQRVMIAKALVGRPELMVLDEPLTGIDKDAGEQLYELLNRLNKEYGMTIVMVTHNMEQVARYTNRFYHVSGGRVHLDKSSVICDEVLKDKMIVAKPRAYRSRNVGKRHEGRNLDSVEAVSAGTEKPYDASYRGRRR